MEDNNMKDEQGLMKKTKKELVEIIFRKDDVERILRDQIKDLMKYNAKLEKQLSANKEIVQTEPLKRDKKQVPIGIKDFIKKFKWPRKG